MQKEWNATCDSKRSHVREIPQKTNPKSLRLDAISLYGSTLCPLWVVGNHAMP